MNGFPDDLTKIYQFDYFGSLNEGKVITADLKINDNSVFKTFDQDPKVYLSWQERVKYIDDWIDHIKEKGWLIIHQHSFAPGMKYAFKNYLSSWKQKVENKGCKFILLTILRQPEKRMISHLKYFNIPQKNVDDYIMTTGSNYILRYLLHGQCDYSFD